MAANGGVARFVL